MVIVFSEAEQAERSYQGVKTRLINLLRPKGSAGRVPTEAPPDPDPGAWQANAEERLALMTDLPRLPDGSFAAPLIVGSWSMTPSLRIEVEEIGVLMRRWHANLKRRQTEAQTEAPTDAPTGAPIEAPTEAQTEAHSTEALNAVVEPQCEPQPKRRPKQCEDR